jgi:hypothetical protein
VTCDAVREPEAEALHAREAPGDSEPVGSGSEGDGYESRSILQEVARAAAEEAAKYLLIKELAELKGRVAALEAQLFFGRPL